MKTSPLYEKKYLQLTFEDRRLISHWRARGLSMTAIAVKINVHKSTVSRELKRNGHKIYRADVEFYDRLDPTYSESEIQKKLSGFGDSQTEWNASDAQKALQYRLHLANKLRPRKKADTAKWVIAKVKLHWSPEQISVRSKLESLEPGG